MNIDGIPFGTTDWSTVERVEHAGETGSAIWRTRSFGAVRVRMVEYSPGYLADHWCSKGHVLLCLIGQLETELDDGRTVTLTPGMSYQVGRRRRGPSFEHSIGCDVVHRRLTANWVEPPVVAPVSLMSVRLLCRVVP